jgi:hypothetical protein
MHAPLLEYDVRTPPEITAAVTLFAPEVIDERVAVLAMISCPSTIGRRFPPDH